MAVKTRGCYGALIFGRVNENAVTSPAPAGCAPPVGPCCVGGAVSSAVEHRFYTPGVGSSILSPPTRHCARSQYPCRRPVAAAVPWGFRAGGRSMTDRERWKERRDRVARYRVWRQRRPIRSPPGSSTILCASWKADLLRLTAVEAQRAMTGECALEPAVAHFHGRKVARSAARGRSRPVSQRRWTRQDRFLLVLPRTGKAHRCLLAWRRDTQIGDGVPTK